MSDSELADRALTASDLGEVVDFFRRSNPFAQLTWGWDTSRFVDWHYSAISPSQQSADGWFSEHCQVFRDDSSIRAVFVAEDRGFTGCIITPSEDPTSVIRVLDWVRRHREVSDNALRFEFSKSAGWLSEIFAGAGFAQGPDSGLEWEYDLDSVSVRTLVPSGYTVDDLTEDRDDDLRGIADCIKMSFGSERDVLSSLRRLRANPMFRPELNIFARSPNGRIAAYCRGTVDPGNGVCGVDPVCCHPDFQRLGLGKAIVQTCFERQRALGGRMSYIGSAPEPAPGTFLYRSLGPESVTVSSTWNSCL